MMSRDNDPNLLILQEDNYSSVSSPLNQRYLYFWSALKWLALAAVTATILYFTGGFLAIPFLAKLGALAIPAVTPVLAGVKAALWFRVIKPLAQRFKLFFRSTSKKPDASLAECPQNQKEQKIDPDDSLSNRSNGKKLEANNGASVPEENKREPAGEKLFLGLGRDVNKMISQSLSAESLASLASTSKTMRHNESLFKRPLKQRAFQLLLEHIVKGNQDAAEKIIKHDPSLLLEKGTVRDYAGYTFKNRTPIQAALAAGMDIDMCEMMLPYFYRLPEGRQKALEQIQAQFPGHEEEKQEPELYDFEPLIQAIIDDPFTNGKPSQETESQLIRLREYFKPGVIETGECFNVHHLIKAIKKQEEYMYLWRPRPNKLNFFWQKVIGFIQRVVPACYAQDLCQGVYGVVFEGWKLDRSLKFQDSNHLYFPLDSNPNFRLGFEYAAVVGDPGYPNRDGHEAPNHYLLEKVWKEKTSALSELINSLSVPTPSHNIFSLKDICMDKLLFSEHKLSKEHIKQSLGLLHDEYKQFKQKKLKGLLEAILRGDCVTTLEMIEKYPILLLEKLEDKLQLHGAEMEGEVAVAPSGHKTTNTTAYRLALAVEDTQLAEKIRDRLVALAGEEVAEAQWHEQFPEGWKAEEKEAWKPFFSQLERLNQAIRQAASGDIVSSGSPDYQLTVREGSGVANKLTEFRRLLDSRRDEILTTGKQFNIKLLITAFEIYMEMSCDYMDNANAPPVLLFWRQVIGCIQLYLPENYKQAFYDGLHNTQNKLQSGRAQGRKLKAPDMPPGARLGFDFALCEGPLPYTGNTGTYSHLRAYCKVKRSKFAELMQPKPFMDPRPNLVAP